MKTIINTDSTNSSTCTFAVEFRQPMFAFQMPTFASLKDKKDPILFYSIEEARKFMKKLPKDWILEMLLNKKQ